MSTILTCIISLNWKVGAGLIGKRLRALREGKGRKQADIAKVLGVSRTTYTQYETEKSEPDLETVKNLAEYFETTTDYLLGKSDTSTPLDFNIKDAPITFMGNTNGLNLDELEKIINRAVKKALDEREKEEETNK